MPLVLAGLVLYIGYGNLVYGWSQVTGCNAGYFDVVLPGKWTGCNPDQAGSPAAGTTKSKSSNAAPGPAKGGYVKPNKKGKCPQGWFLAGDGYCGQRVGD
jgi:hypothetical protein